MKESDFIEGFTKAVLSKLLETREKLRSDLSDIKVIWPELLAEGIVPSMTDVEFKFRELQRLEQLCNHMVLICREYVALRKGITYGEDIDPVDARKIRGVYNLIKRIKEEIIAFIDYQVKLWRCVKYIKEYNQSYELMRRKLFIRIARIVRKLRLFNEDGAMRDPDVVDSQKKKRDEQGKRLVFLLEEIKIWIETEEMKQFNEKDQMVEIVRTSGVYFSSCKIPSEYRKLLPG
jgi:hypothetical protein